MTFHDLGQENADAVEAKALDMPCPHWTRGVGECHAEPGVYCGGTPEECANGKGWLHPRRILEASG
jgi:hypothetical protein